MDCVDYLKNLNNRIIDCIILDPPYFEVVNEKWDNGIMIGIILTTI